jgi:hypothetical protein
MAIPRNRVALAAVMTAGAIAFVAVSVAHQEPANHADLSRPITRADAESLLAQTVRLAQSGDVHRICKTLAAAEANCEALLGTRYPVGKLAPTVAGFDSGRTAVLHLEGTRDDGTAYTSDFAVVRTAPDRVVGMTPIYWSGVIVGRNPPLTTTSATR